MLRIGLSLLALGSVAGQPLDSKQATFAARFISLKDGVCHVIDTPDVSPQPHRLVHIKNSTIIERVPLQRDPHDAGEHAHHHHQHHHEEEMVTIHAASLGGVERALGELCTQRLASNATESKGQDEVIEIVNSGPSANRIDVVFMGDGYTTDQRQLFIDDMVRLTADMFEGDTFGAYLPVFNIWAVFRPSREEGIGVGGQPRDTSFRLYRDGTQLRGVFTGNAAAAREACRATGPGGCNFPSLIGNDLYYGGLGGEFTITTSSPTSGTIVFRHEMGHNFISVGEEYDGGSAYFGVNHANSLANVGWSAWLTEPGPPAAEDMRIMIQDYAWYDLAQGNYDIQFTSQAGYDQWLLRFSVSGCETDGAISVHVDDVELEWQSQHTHDRTFFEYTGSLAAGQHVLSFRQRTPAGERPRQLCSVGMHEYGVNFNHDDDYVGAYPTWRTGGSLVGYRPMNEKCLMRNMSSTIFCPVCYEGMWMQFFARMSLIDGASVTCISEVEFRVDLELVADVGSARKGNENNKHNEELLITWSYNGVPQPHYDNLRSIEGFNMNGGWEAQVVFVTDMVRHDPNSLLTFNHPFSIEC